MSLPPTPALTEGPPASAPRVRAIPVSPDEKPRRRFRGAAPQPDRLGVPDPGSAADPLDELLADVPGLHPLAPDRTRDRLNFAEPLWYNYQRLFSDEIFKLTVQNTLIYLVVQVPIMLILALILANLLNDKNLRFKGMWRTAIFLPCAVSLVSYSLVFRTMFSNRRPGQRPPAVHAFVDSPVNWLGQTATARMVLVLGLIWRWTGYNMVFYLAAMQNLDYSTLEAARIDGAGSVQDVLVRHHPATEADDPADRHPLDQRHDPALRRVLEPDPGRPGVHVHDDVALPVRVVLPEEPQLRVRRGISYAILIMVAVLAAIQMKVGDKRD